MTQTATNPALDQYFTPEWAAQELVDTYLAPMLSMGDNVIEPSCGRGAFLKALIPVSGLAVGYEIDPELAAEARDASGCAVFADDFTEACLDHIEGAVKALVGNPPFSLKLFRKFLDRAKQILRPDGFCAFILPAYFLQTSRTVMGLAKDWSVETLMLPRDLFPGLSKPLCFCILRPSPGGVVLEGHALYEETAAVRSMPGEVRERLAHGRARMGVWDALVTEAIAAAGGEATIQGIFKRVRPNAPASNSFPRERIRATLYRGSGSRYAQDEFGFWRVYKNQQ